MSNHPIPQPPRFRPSKPSAPEGYCSATPRIMCPAHGSQAVTLMAGDLSTIHLACGGVVTDTGTDHPGPCRRDGDCASHPHKEA